MIYYLGLCTLVDRSLKGLQLAPAVTAFGQVVEEVITATDERFQESLQYRLWDRLRFYVLALDEHRCRLIREWVVAPAELVGTVVDHTTGEVEELRVEETGSLPSPTRGRARRSSLAGVCEEGFLLGPVSSPFDAPLYLGVRQVVRPDAEVSVLPPTVLAIGLDRAAVETRTRELFVLRSRHPKQYKAHYWVLEHHHGVTLSVADLSDQPPGEGPPVM